MTLGPAIILIAVAAIAGYVLGIVDSRITASLHKKTEESPTPTTETAEPITSDPNRIGEHTVLKVLIDKALKWHFELDGVRLENPDAISPEQRQRAADVVVHIQPWLGEKPARAIPVLSAPLPVPELPPLKPLNTAMTAQSPASTPPLKIDAMRGFRSLLKNEVKTPDSHKGLSIVAMIDEVLQVKLLGTPLKDRTIRLEDGPMGGVIVCVDTHRYPGVDAVPEPEIREIIKAAITDWEKK